MSAPADILLLQALHAFEAAQLQLTAGRHADAADSIQRGVALVRKALDA